MDTIITDLINSKAFNILYTSILMFGMNKFLIFSLIFNEKLVPYNRSSQFQNLEMYNIHVVACHLYGLTF